MPNVHILLSDQFIALITVVANDNGSDIDIGHGHVWANHRPSIGTNHRQYAKYPNTVPQVVLTNDKTAEAVKKMKIWPGRSTGLQSPKMQKLKILTTVAKLAPNRFLMACSRSVHQI